jgi:hypothetical protein
VVEGVIRPDLALRCGVSSSTWARLHASRFADAHCREYICDV